MGALNIATRARAPYYTSVRTGHSALRSNAGEELPEAMSGAAAILATASALASSAATDYAPFLQVASVLSAALGVWALLQGSKNNMQPQPAMAGYGTPASTTSYLASTAASSTDDVSSSSTFATTATPSVAASPATTAQDGLSKRGFHITQVPTPSKTVASYRNVALPAHDPATTYAVAVVGAGPAGMALAWQLAKEKVSVVLVDNAFENDWPNNYGVWAKEWEATGLPANTLGTVWDTTRITFKSDEGVLLDAPYGRVNREAAKTWMLQQCVDLGVHFCSGQVKVLQGTDAFDERVVIDVNSKGGNKTEVLCQMPVVAAGHYSPLLKYQSPGEAAHTEGEWMTKDWSHLLSANTLQGKPEAHVAGGGAIKGSAWGWNYGMGSGPAYQVAYGEEIICEEPHGYPVNEMLLMDWSDDHFGDDRSKDSTPTFLYAMPSDEYRIFVEDTSLVARPTVGMEDLKTRLYQRLDHRGIKVKEVVEVEKSVIPLGGPLPLIGSRAIAYGASNNLVHPATGYMVNRAIAEAPDLAKTIAGALRAGQSIEDSTAAAWETLWPHDKLRTRDFHVFAMEMLVEMDIELIREFFRTFFKDLELSSWKEYLAWSMDRNDMMQFAMGIWLRANLTMKAKLITETFDKDGFSVIRSLLGM